MNYTKSVPSDVYVACSGGADSVAAAAILHKWRKVTLCHFGHKDQASEWERVAVSDLARDLEIPVLFRDSDKDTPATNKEAEWRKDRYEWFHTLDKPVVTGHTLDDAVEWYLITCLRGRGEFMEYSNKNVIRPFLLTRKQELADSFKNMNLHCRWWEDHTNDDPDFCLRNKVRKNMLPIVEDCEPGIYNVVKRNIVRKIS